MQIARPQTLALKPRNSLTQPSMTQQCKSQGLHIRIPQVGTEDPWGGGGGGGVNDLIPTPKYHKGLGPKTPRP